MATKECTICGTIMNNVRSDKKYCSRKCQNVAAWKNKDKTRIKICEYCKEEFEPLKYGTTRNYCFNCIPESFKQGNQMRKKIKEWAIKYKGGQCENCGYNKCYEALDFHHRDKTQKDFCISDRNLTLHWDEIKKELDKCSLLCANCHREEHSKEGL